MFSRATDSERFMTRHNSFDFLRLLGAFLVFYGHHFALTGVPEPIAYRLATFAGVDTNFFSLSGLGVYIFFSISGYLITISWQRDPNFFRFAGKRLLRIMPGLIVTVAACALILGPAVSSLSVPEYYGHPGMRFYFSNLAFYPVYALPGVFADSPHPHAVNGSLWTLPLEFFLYFAIMLFLVAVKNRLARIVFLVGAVLSVGLIGLFFVSTLNAPLVFYGNDLRFLFLLAPFFLAGSLIACINSERIMSVRVAAALLIVFMLLPEPVLKIAAFFILPYCVLSLGVASLPVLRRAGRWGDFSYGLYIYAFPMQQLTIHALGAGAHQMTVFILSLAGTLACAVVSWHCVEKPMLALKPRGGGCPFRLVEKPAASSDY